MTTHIYQATEQTALEAMVLKYGDHLERLSLQQKLFIMGTLSLSLYGSHTLSGAIDELDPEAQFVATFIDLVEQLERSGRQELLLLIATIANQLAWNTCLKTPKP